MPHLLRANIERPVREFIRADLPVEFDATFYRDHHPDLAHFSNQHLHEHFVDYGRKEGRPGSHACLRSNFVSLAASERLVLEVGPFCSPVVKGENVRYFDVLDSAGLAERALAVGRDPQPPKLIDYVSPIGDLDVVRDRFSAMISSHSIEHQPDLIRHLQHAARLLEAGGRYFLLIPDKRYCFDYFLAESTFADALDAYVAGCKTHSLKSVIEHLALTTHNDAMRHWQDDHCDEGYSKLLAPRAKAAMEVFDAAAGNYIDVHAWQFTPESFRRLIDVLFELKLTELKVERVYNTPYGHNEFTAILSKVS